VITNAVLAVVNLYSLLVFGYVLMSWFPVRGTLYDVYQVVGSVVEPYVGLFRRIIPPLGGMDFSPWAAILALRWVIMPLLVLVLNGS
jgi:uncharacterized protein YggT (Ycf19 family)